MTSKILNTKFYIPTPHPNLVSRNRLLDKLNGVWEHKIVLVSAPAGFGKTTLMSDWISRQDPLVCWLSLDGRDDDLVRFLRYFLFALKQIESDLGESALMLLQSSQAVDTENLLTVLANEVADFAEPFVFVLDDYHVITDPEIQQALVFFLDHLPRQMHLVITSRADPPWPLARLRVRGEILEIRSQEMRFTTEETASFLNQLMGLRLSPVDISALERRTEGWIAGLQMAAISMRGHQNLAGFIHSFTGSHRFVVDYLVEEVLDQQPAEIRDFLLKTSILDRMTGSLCDVIVDGENSQSVLFDLEQKNLFLTPLDDQRRWYRYHHLFADLLRNHLRQNFPDDVAHLHQRASIWYGMNDLLPDAIKHALAFNDIEGVIHLTKGLALDTMEYGDFSELMGWLNGLPESEYHRYPWLWVARAQARYKTGNFESAGDDLDVVESIIAQRAESDEMRIHIQGHIAAIRSYLAELKDDPHSTLRQAEDALALLPENEIKLRAFISIRQANCLAWFGDLEEAIRVYQKTGEASKQIGDGQTAIIALSEMAVIQMVAGRLQQANRNISDTCKYAEEFTLRDGRRLPAMGNLYRQMSQIKWEMNELAEAAACAERAVRICRGWGDKEALLFAVAALARVQFSRGEFVKAEQNLAEMLSIAGQISPRTLAQFQNLKFHYQLMQGKTEEAEKWVHDLGLQVEDAFDYPRRIVYQNFARLLAAKGESVQALIIVEALKGIVTGAGDRVGTIRYHVFQAILLNRVGRSDEALVSMARALSLARPEGYMGTILDEGAAVGDLLRLAMVRGCETVYASKLLAALEDESGRASLPGFQGMEPAEPLSQREREILRLLLTEMTTTEIADHLIISVSTVRTHIKNIYGKLDVHSRLEAISKAKKLDLF